ncbi:hypothetical protein BDZ97DRAFT_1930446 [Flammula alnicola]|nr:hypothetical protein BDZ97DRAFT_1930446 [Flammula alnicola]
MEHFVMESSWPPSCETCTPHVWNPLLTESSYYPFVLTIDELRSPTVSAYKRKRVSKHNASLHEDDAGAGPADTTRGRGDVQLRAMDTNPFDFDLNEEISAVDAPPPRSQGKRDYVVEFVNRVDEMLQAPKPRDYVDREPNMPTLLRPQLGYLEVHRLHSLNSRLPQIDEQMKLRDKASHRHRHRSDHRHHEAESSSHSTLHSNMDDMAPGDIHPTNWEQEAQEDVAYLEVLNNLRQAKAGTWDGVDPSDPAIFGDGEDDFEGQEAHDEFLEFEPYLPAPTKPQSR